MQIFLGGLMRYVKMREEVDEISRKIKDEKIRKMFLECFYNTLETTTEYLPDGTTYVFTGDIPAMWLRDSSVQVSGYLLFAKRDNDVKEMIKGLIRRQFAFIQLDPYANAFNFTPHKDRHVDDTDFLHENVWERKYEVDSLCYPLWLLIEYYGRTRDKSVFDNEFIKTFETVLNTFIKEQKHAELSSYYFKRTGHWAFDTLDNDGKGSKTAYTGMIWSAFRPSDDKCKYHYLVPANQMVIAVFRRLIPIIKETLKNYDISKAEKFVKEVEDGVQKFGITDVPAFGRIFAYETDGLGNYNLMDDANVPSLLSLPYLGYCAIDDEIYQNTKKFILSKANPYYFEGKYAKGVGSPHTPENYVWHIALAIQLLTSNDKDEIENCFKTLVATGADTGLMHEGFNVDDPGEFTREWFAWANTLFALAAVKQFHLL